MGDSKEVNSRALTLESEAELKEERDRCTLTAGLSPFPVSVRATTIIQKN